MASRWQVATVRTRELMAEFGEIVRAHYRGRLDDGREFESTWRTGEPIEVRIGAGRLLPAVEQMLCSMMPGEKKTIRLEPTRAYGVYDPNLVQRVPVSLLPNAEKLPVGAYIELRTAQGTLRAKVESVDADEVVLDCNHELASQPVTFDLELASVVREDVIEREKHPAGCACGCDKVKEALLG